MRILLDEHVSPRKVGAALRAQGHDVRAVAEEPGLAGLEDRAIFSTAIQDGRILVTFNHRDFVPLLRERAEANGHHPGCIIVYGIRHDQIGLILRSLERLFAQRPDQVAWTDIVEALSRGT